MNSSLHLPYSCSSTHRDADYPRFCDLCTESVKLCSRLEFSQHLRRMHCTKEGGSFICRYGLNGVCQTLPLEGVSDHDYEAHIRKFHANVVFDKEPIVGAVSNGKNVHSSSKLPFTVQSFTQNLAAILLDSKRSRTDVQTFFTRHWGDSFIPKKSVPPSQSLPVITQNHFRKYLDTTAKKHRQCLRAKRELRRTLARHEEDTRTDADDVPPIFLNPHFSLADSSIFEAIFLEPLPGDPDRLLVDGKSYMTFLQRQHYSSSSSLAPNVSEDSELLQVHKMYEAGKGRCFRNYDTLQNCLEHFHDLIDSRLNNQLALKSSAFWKTVISCGSLSGELADAKERVTIVRENLKKVDEKLYCRMMNVVSMYMTRQRYTKMLQTLQDIACLRDAQITVQVLLNQNDYPKALECIETAQDVLNNELRGVKCFRHLGSQLQELHKVIAKMLYEEFVTLVQRELGRPCETESDAVYQGGQVNPLIVGLLRVKEYRFVHVLQQEIVEVLKNLLRQIIKTHVLKSIGDNELTEFEPSLGNISSQMRKLNFEQWFGALQHVLHVFYLMCRRVQSIQEILLDHIEHFEDVVAKKSSQGKQSSREVEMTEESVSKNFMAEHIDISFPTHSSEDGVGMIDSEDEMGTEINHFLKENNKMANVATVNDKNVSENFEKHESSNFEIGKNEVIGQRNVLHSGSGISNTITSPPASTPAAFLSIPCRTIGQVKQSIALLAEHATYTAQERSCRLLVASSKHGFLERLSLTEFESVLKTVQRFVQNCRYAIGTEEKFSSPLHMCVIQQSSCFIKKFHEDRKAKLGNILDTETWRASEVPEHFQRLVDSCLETNCLTDVLTLEKGKALPPARNLLVAGQPYVVVGTAFILLQMMAQYCDALVVLPEYASEILMCLVELLKNYNSRSCQLILGAGALQLIGLKSISVRHLALSSRCLQLILRFVPFVRTHFHEKLPADKQSLLRHVDQLVRDYNDHAQEIMNKLISVIDHHLVKQLQTWEVKGSTPSPTFQHLCRQLGKFYNGLTGVMPESMIKDLFLRVHENFKRSLKVQLDNMNITPHDSLKYGLASQEYLFYIRSLQAMPCCSDMKDESISEALFSKN